MSIRSSQSITTQFTTRVFSTGVLTDADSTPTGTLYVNGTANGASVTVTKISTGLYKAAFTLPSLSVGDWCCLMIAATVSSVSDTAKVWEDTKDIVIDSAGLADANAVKLGPSGSGTAQTARDIGASVLLSAGTGTGQVNLSSGKVPATIAAGDLATDSITADALKADAVTEIQSGLMLASSYTAPPTAAQNRAEMDSNSTKLAHLDADVSTRLATSGYTAPDNSGIASAASSAATAATQTTAANIRSAMGLSAANLDSQLGAIPTVFRLKKNTAFNGFSLVMFNTSGVAATGKTVSGSVSIDGGAFGALTNSVSEIGSGAYKVNLAAADTNGNDLLFLFTATDCKPLFLKVITQP